jgi:hypothetical protein
MSMTRTTLCAAVLAAAALAPAAAAEGAATILSTEPASTRVAAWGETVMWSQLDPATGSYRLVKSVGGAAPVPVAVPQRAGAVFDIDLGTNRSHNTFAVYTRGGDLYRLNVATGAERRLDALSSSRLAERDPTIQRGRIAFIRRSGGRDELRIGDTTSGSKGSTLVVRKRSIVSAELGIRHVAYVEAVPLGFAGLLVHVRNLRTGADRVVYKAVSGGANAARVTRPSYIASPEAFMWARTNTGSGRGNRLVRYTLRGSKLAYAQGSHSYNSTAWVGGKLGTATASSLDASADAAPCADAGKHYCFVGLTGETPFDLGP